MSADNRCCCCGRPGAAIVTSALGEQAFCPEHLAYVTDLAAHAAKVGARVATITPIERA